uniref:Ion transport domain-containing protein n=1 Tax=Polarella glacialis TaxID=89957 RepID=A0A813EM26_POLGL|nr:unnamed protein product [Polarella glacialis]
MGDDGSGGSARALKLVRFARLFRLLKLARMLKLFKLAESAESSVEVSPLLIKLTSLCLKVCFLAHLVACLWHWLTTFDVGEDGCSSGRLGCDRPGHDVATTWIAKMGPGGDVDTDQEKYIAALYWVFTTMTTVGYGDIIPTNNLERAVAVWVMICGATVFGYIVGSVAELATSRPDPAVQCLVMLRHYCEEQNLSQTILRSVRRHYEFWYQEQSPFDYESEMLQKLPSPLRKDVILHIHKHVFAGVSLFRHPMPSWLQAIIVRMLEPQAYGPGELIIFPGEVVLQSDIFFVQAGECEAYLPLLNRPSAAPSRRKSLRTSIRNEEQLESKDQAAIETYGPGTMLGFEKLLGEASMMSFGCPQQAGVRATPKGVCFTFALRIPLLVDAQRANANLGFMLQEIVTQAVVKEGKRRLKERHRTGSQVFEEAASRCDPKIGSSRRTAGSTKTEEERVGHLATLQADKSLLRGATRDSNMSGAPVASPGPVPPFIVTVTPPVLLPPAIHSPPLSVASSNSGERPISPSPADVAHAPDVGDGLHSYGDGGGTGSSSQVPSPSNSITLQPGAWSLHAPQYTEEEEDAEVRRGQSQASRQSISSLY